MTDLLRRTLSTNICSRRYAVAGMSGSPESVENKWWRWLGGLVCVANFLYMTEAVLLVSYLCIVPHSNYARATSRSFRSPRRASLTVTHRSVQGSVRQGGA
jgi:hypothetical protein